MDSPDQPPYSRRLGSQLRCPLAYPIFFSPQRPLYNALYPSRGDFDQWENGTSSDVSSSPLDQCLLLLHRHLRFCLWSYIRLHAPLPRQFCGSLAGGNPLVYVLLDLFWVQHDVRKREHRLTETREDTLNTLSSDLVICTDTRLNESMHHYLLIHR